VWDWINDYGAGIGAVATAATAVIAIIAVLATSFDSRARSQPMVAAEFRTAPDSDTTIEFVITNLGPTPARDVFVSFDPPIVIPNETEAHSAPYLLKRYARPIPVLNPGQLLSNTWYSARDLGGAELENSEPTPDEVRVSVSYRGLGLRRIRDSFDLTVETVTLTTFSVSSTSYKGRLKTIDASLKKMGEHLSVIAKKIR
jgi:hypothetical protein